MYKLLEERETLNGLSMLDPLTGLYNRRGLQNKLNTLLALETHEEHYVLLLDIDHFKAYNDHYGHMMGDQALSRSPRFVTLSVPGILSPVLAVKSLWFC